MRPAVVLLALACGGAAPGCRTTDIVNGFNDGTHGTEGNPTTQRAQRGRDPVAAMLRDTLARGYYRNFNRIRREIDVAGHYFPKGVRHAAQILAATSARGRGTRLETQEATEVIDRATHEGLRLPWRPKPPAEICDGDAPSAATYEFLDRVRFEVAYLQAIETAAHWVREGLVDDQNLKDGAKDGFAEVEAYLAKRTWAREEGRPVRGLVVSGGSSNGMFSAGAVWFTLNVLERVMSDPKRPPATDPRFQIISGTSAGAMIATAVDLFNLEVDAYLAQKRTDPLVAKSLDSIAYWFTCLPANQFYCVDDASTTSLFADRVGVVRFDGIRKLLVKVVDPGMLTNSSELLLNTVDFQTGEVLSLSDQDPCEARDKCDIVDHALASIPLPLIAQPYPVERVQDRRRQGFYLDGGVRATLPLVPLARRGAERVLLVSSSASVIPGAPPPRDAIELLKRYTGLESGNTVEEGVAYATALAKRLESEETSACCRSYDRDLGCAGNDDAAAFCDGRYTCKAGKLHRETRRTRPAWQLTEIYRNEAKVPEAAGYSFDPRESLPLFLAGMASARIRCPEILRFFDLEPAGNEALCDVPLPTREICKDETKKPFPEIKGSEPRMCKAGTEVACP